MKPRLFALLSLAFVIATIVGTVSHELGHIAVAKALGYSTQLHYAAMNYSIDERHNKLGEYYDAHKSQVFTKAATPQKAYFEREFAAIEKDSFMVTLGGPLQTIFTGFTGLGMLWFRRKRIKEYGLAVADWLYIFLAFFISRQVFNGAFALLGYIRRGKASVRSDESRIDAYLKLPIMTTGLVTGTIALALLVWVTFYVLPRPQRLTFVASGIAGSALGWMIWMHWLGPVLLP